MNRGRWGVGVERRRPGSGVATSRGLREATATAGTPGSGSRVRAQISQCLSSQNSHEVWRLVKRAKFVLSSSCCSYRRISSHGALGSALKYQHVDQNVKNPTYLGWRERVQTDQS